MGIWDWNCVVCGPCLTDKICTGGWGWNEGCKLTPSFFLASSHWCTEHTKSSRDREVLPIPKMIKPLLNSFMNEVRHFRTNRTWSLTWACGLVSLVGKTCHTIPSIMTCRRSSIRNYRGNKYFFWFAEIKFLKELPKRRILFSKQVVKVATLNRNQKRHPKLSRRGVNSPLQITVLGSSQECSAFGQEMVVARILF